MIKQKKLTTDDEVFEHSVVRFFQVMFPDIIFSNALLQGLFLCSNDLDEKFLNVLLNGLNLGSEL